MSNQVNFYLCLISFVVFYVCAAAGEVNPELTYSDGTPIISEENLTTNSEGESNHELYKHRRCPSNNQICSKTCEELKRYYGGFWDYSTRKCRCYCLTATGKGICKLTDPVVLPTTTTTTKAPTTTTTKAPSTTTTKAPSTTTTTGAPADTTTTTTTASPAATTTTTTSAPAETTGSDTTSTAQLLEQFDEDFDDFDWNYSYDIVLDEYKSN